MPHKPINVVRVMELCREGLTAAEIGRRLAREEGRAIDYQPNSIAHAIRRERMAVRGRLPLPKRRQPLDSLLRVLRRVHGVPA